MKEQGCLCANHAAIEGWELCKVHKRGAVAIRRRLPRHKWEKLQGLCGSGVEILCAAQEDRAIGTARAAYRQETIPIGGNPLTASADVHLVAAGFAALGGTGRKRILARTREQEPEAGG
jgi:hypothetical protein